MRTLTSYPRFGTIYLMLGTILYPWNVVVYRSHWYWSNNPLLASCMVSVTTAPAFTTTTGMVWKKENDNIFGTYSLFAPLYAETCGWESMGAFSQILRCRYSAVHPNPHKIHPIARPWGRVMECLSWIEPLMHILPQSSLYHIQNHFILNRFMMALDCINM